MFERTLQLLLIGGFLIQLLCITSSCQPQGDLSNAQLEVNVSGTLSGKPRSVSVKIYLNETDAEDQQNPVMSGSSDSDGKAYFTGLNIGQAYWVRANALLSHNINQTRSLKAGGNVHSINVL